MSADILQLSTEEHSTEVKIDTDPEQSPDVSPEKRSKKLFRNKKFDAVWITVVFLSSMSWTLWELTHFQSSVEYKQELIQRQYHLDTEIQSLKGQIKNHQQNANNSKTDIAQSTVFSGYTEIAEWLYRLTEESRRNDLRMEYQLYDAELDERLHNIYNIPIELELIAVREHNLDVAYQQFLNFIEIFISQARYILVTAASIENIGSNSARLIMKFDVRKREDNISTISNEPELPGVMPGDAGM